MTLPRAVALTLIVVGAVVLTRLGDRLGGITGMENLELRTQDWRQVLSARTVIDPDRDSDVVLVMFDEASVMEWEYFSPFPRSVLAELVDAVSSAGARAIGLDVYLDRRMTSTPQQREADQSLRDAMARAGNVVLVGPVVSTDSGPRLQEPHPYFADVAADIGAADLPTAFEVVRDGSLAVRSGPGLEPSFALALYGQARGLDVDSLLLRSRSQGRVAIEGLPADVGRIPESWFEQGADVSSVVVPIYIRFEGPPSRADAQAPPGGFRAYASNVAPMTALLDPDLFRDKVVLVGSGFHDSDKFRTAFFNDVMPTDSTTGFYQVARPYSWMYGVEVHANILDNLLDREFVRPLRGGWEVVLLLGAALLAGWAVFRWGAGVGALVSLASIGVAWVVAYWLWSGQVWLPGGVVVADLGNPFLWVPMVTPALAAVLSYVGSVAYVSVVEGREKRFIKGAFGKYVSPEIVAEIAANPGLLQLGGSKHPVTLLFSDLAGFTTLSERMDPQDLLAYLNEYLSDMTQIVLDEQGYLDKYIGDAIMAFWNAPKAVPDHADRALRAAVLMQRRMEHLNARWQENDPEAEDLVVRIGINTGTVVVGNVGGAERFDYSAIGDAVNLAARLEPANKSYDTLVMASEFTMAEADRDAFRVRELDLIAVKGKVEPVKVYEVLELAGVELAPHREEALRHFESGMQAYHARDWTLASTYFEAGLEADASDGPSRVYLERCAAHVADPPPSDWDFVVRRTSK